MIKKTFILTFYLLSNYFIYGSYESPISQIDFNNEEIQIPFELVKIMPSEHSPAIQSALAKYHATRPFTQTWDEFMQHPYHYFDKRKKALDTLIETLSNSPDNSSLLSMAINKRLYIESLPHPLTTECLHPDLRNLAATKGIKLLESYSLEALDPLHRAGPGKVIRELRWRDSQIPNYFIYLETTEDNELLQYFAPNDFQIQYFYHPSQRAQHRLFFHNGRVYDSQGQLFDTAQFETAHSGNDFAIFVLGTDGEFYANQHLKYRIHHSSEFAGGEVDFAGEITARDGKIVLINNKSGHYRPTDKDTLFTLKALQEKLGSLDDIVIELRLLTNSLGDDATFSAKEFLKTEGHCKAIKANLSSPLHVAILLNHENLSDELCREWDVNAVDNKGNTPLHYAVTMQSLHWINALLTRGANPDQPNEAQLTPLELACKNGYLHAIVLFRRYSKSKDETLALFQTAQSGNLEALERLLRDGPPATSRDKDGNTLWHWAARAPIHSVLESLIESYGTSGLEIKNHDGALPLHMAAAYGNPWNIQILLDNGSNLYACDNKHNTAMHYAAKNKNSEAVDYLLTLDSAASWKKPNKNGVYPLHYAAQSLPKKTFMKLMTRKKDINLPDAEGKTPLMYAAEKQNNRQLTYLLNLGASLRAEAHDGLTAIHSLLKAPKKLPLMLVLTYDNLLDWKDHRGNTLLHLSVLNNNIKATEYLIPYYGIEGILQLNDEGKTPLDLAREIQNDEIATLFENVLAE